MVGKLIREYQVGKPIEILDSVHVAESRFAEVQEKIGKGPLHEDGC